MIKIGRRGFLVAAAGGAVAAVNPGGAAAAAPTTHEVWRLSATWGYAVPPKGRTNCKCKACRSNAANKVYQSRSAALAGRIHPCCVCQPYSVPLLAVDVARLFPPDGPSVPLDLRQPILRLKFELAVLNASSPAVPAPVLQPAAPLSVPAVEAQPQPTAVAPEAQAPNPTAVDVFATPLDPASTAPDHVLAEDAAMPTTAGDLPTTGSDAFTTAAIAATLVGAGVVALRTARPQDA